MKTIRYYTQYKFVTAIVHPEMIDKLSALGTPSTSVLSDLQLTTLLIILANNSDLLTLLEFKKKDLHTQNFAQL